MQDAAQASNAREGKISLCCCSEFMLTKNRIAVCIGEEQKGNLRPTEETIARTIEIEA